ncbi:MAG TPA: hypothetical protein VG713_01395 [Pirellulales bacterium]|nr:hypothetical protein [Pirellulales bacterium]
MNWGVAFFIAAANTALALGGYLAWPSRWNIPTLLGVSFCLTAFWIPMFSSMGYNSPSEQITNLYVLLMCIAIPGFIIGIFLGKTLYRGFGFRNLEASRPLEFDWLVIGKVCRKTAFLLVIGLGGMALSFYLMGYVPMFAADPMAAKFFKGEYQHSYSKVALLHRTAWQFITFAMPVGLYLGFLYRRAGVLALSIVSILCMALTLSRTSTLLGLLTALGLIAARQRSTFFAYFIFLVLMMPLGSASFYIIDQIFPHSGFGFSNGDSLADQIAQGAPDVNDQLSLLDSFQASQEWTYGRTFVGALVPYNFRWNPAVWALTTVSGSPDVSNTNSGGYRLPVSLWGYVAFGYTGAFFVPLLSGLIAGWWGALMYQHVDGTRPVQTILWISLYSTLGNQMIQYYLLSIYSLPSIVCALFLLMGTKVRYLGAHHSATTTLPKLPPQKLPQPIGANS